MSHRVVVTGLGCVSSLGVGCRQFWCALERGESAIRPTRVEKAGLENTFPAAPVHADYDPRAHFSPDELPLRDPFAQYAVVAAREAMSDAGLRPFEGNPARTAVILGTGGGGEHAREDAAVRLFVNRKLKANPMLVPKTNNQAAVGFVSMEFGATGPSFVVSTGCAAATHAVAQAFLTVRHGLADRAIAGGSEAPLMLSIFQAFDAARVVSHTTCRPFSRARDGMVLGEGGGAVVLETLESARARGARVYAELAGVGLSADADSSVHPKEDGPAQAIATALADAGVNADEVDYINAHGTGTEVNDRVESHAIARVFGHHARRLSVSSTKSMHGHAFGGAGAIELVATLLAMQHGVVPPTANYLGPDGVCALDYVPNEARRRRVDVALKQSFAFGGLNAVLVLRRDVPLS
jgi:nodulation protein E